VIFFKESDLWDDWLARCNKETKALYIATYNFNFNKYEKSFYQKFSHLANKEELYIEKTSEVIPELRYLDGIAKTFRQTIQYQSILIGIIFICNFMTKNMFFILLLVNL